jgi:hypothetical protein
MTCAHSHFVTGMCTDLLNMVEFPRMRAHGETQDGVHDARQLDGVLDLNLSPAQQISMDGDRNLSPAQPRGVDGVLDLNLSPAQQRGLDGDRNLSPA